MARRGGRVLVRTDKELQARNDTERKVATGKTWKGPYWQARMGKMWISGVGRGMTRISRKGEVRNDMESTRMARISRHGS